MTHRPAGTMTGRMENGRWEMEKDDYFGVTPMLCSMKA